MPVKKFFIFLALSYWFCLASGGGELLKTPFLFSHYQKHKKENKATSFISFLLQHYKYEKKPDKDSKEDNQLPFKSGEITTAISLLSVLPNPFIELPPKCSTQLVTNFHRYNNKPFNPAICNSIWHPPRYC